MSAFIIPPLLSSLSFRAMAGKVRVKTTYFKTPPNHPSRVKTYDTRVQRKPVGDVILGETLHRMIIDPADRVLSASLSEGSVVQFDLRTQKKTNALRAPGPLSSSVHYSPCLRS